jgi:para-nitrobenzyl esterase
MIGCTRNDISIEPGTEGRKSALFKGCTDFADMRIANSDEPVYVYYFARALPGDEAGAFHSSELWYMFGTLDKSWRPFTDGDYALSAQMVDAWTSFCKTGNPGWDAYTAENPVVQVFDVK